jgi:hypothetical protein
VANKALAFLDAKHAVFLANEAAWLREERRLYGGDPVLIELEQFKGESTKQFERRKTRAPYVNFPEQHVSIIAGHLQQQNVIPDFGTLGRVRARKEMSGSDPDVAELLYYNADGIGNDGSQWDAFLFGVEMRALATGIRWLLVEMPELLDARGNKLTRPPTNRDVIDGLRPYLVEYAATQVPYWQHTRGRLDAWIGRVPVTPKGAKLWQRTSEDIGYYLFVRRGFLDFGTQYANGGWWLFDPDKELVSSGNLDRTLGQIPIVPRIGMHSRGTAEMPAISKSLTMELGQVAVAVMNLLSARDYDAIDAAMSVLYIAGVSSEAFKLINKHKSQGSKNVPVLGDLNPETGAVTVPTFYDGSMGAIASGVFDTILKSYADLAREMMIRQVTSPDASGESRRVEFSEGKSPLLAGVATRRETCENALIYFAELRANLTPRGIVKPRGFTTYSRDFLIEPLLTKIDRGLKRLVDSHLDSPTLSASLIVRSAREEGMLPEGDDIARQIEAELVASGERLTSKAQAETAKAWVDAGAPLPFAAEQAGLDANAISELAIDEGTDEELPTLDDVPATEKTAAPPIPPNAE